MKIRFKGHGREGLNWNTTAFMIIFHIGAVVALFYWSWWGLLTAGILGWVAGSLGTHEIVGG